MISFYAEPLPILITYVTENIIISCEPSMLCNFILGCETPLFAEKKIRWHLVNDVDKGHIQVENPGVI